MTQPTSGPHKSKRHGADAQAEHFSKHPCPTCGALSFAQDPCPLHAQAPALREALAKLSEAVRATREGKRDGGTFGALSAADDEARAVLKACEP